MITIPLDETLTATENAKKYFDRYGKLKRTYEALTTLTQETKDTIDHLEYIHTALNIALAEEDLVQIREELAESGYIRRKGGQKKVKITSRPFHYLSSDGFHIYVGKNNLQNDGLTFKFASSGDWWFHAKGIRLPCGCQNRGQTAARPHLRGSRCAGRLLLRRPWKRKGRGGLY